MKETDRTLAGGRKVVLYTQRVEIVTDYGERRDCADQNIPRFIEACGYFPVPAPNVWSVAEKMLLYMQPSGIVLTGGNSLVKYGGDAPERDCTESKILDFAIVHDIPVYGFCRGMQVIEDYFGCVLENVQGHVAVRHKIQGICGEMEVNSFHGQACTCLAEPLEALAQSEDGVIEAVRHKNKRILGTMWHPEREHPFSGADMRRVKEMFG